MNPTDCPYCGSSVSLTHHNGKTVYRCDGFPVCDARVGCHPGTDRAVGTLADARLRRWRINAHARIDPLWRDGAMSRASVYKWLADTLEIERSECHIGMFDVEQCKATIQAVQSLTSSKLATF